MSSSLYLLGGVQLIKRDFLTTPVYELQQDLHLEWPLAAGSHRNQWIPLDFNEHCVMSCFLCSGTLEKRQALM